jgi:hypothetical protein
MLNFLTVRLAFSNLDVFIAPGRLHMVDWAKMEEKSVKKIDVRQGNSLSIAGRTTLINLTLLSITCPCILCLKLWQGGSLKKEISSCTVEEDM